MSLEDVLLKLKNDISRLFKYLNKNVEISYTIEAKDCLGDSCSIQPIELRIEGIMKGFKLKLLLQVDDHSIDISRIKEIKEKPVFFIDDE